MEKYKIPNEKSIKRRVVEKYEIPKENVGFWSGRDPQIDEKSIKRRIVEKYGIPKENKG